MRRYYKMTIDRTEQGRAFQLNGAGRAIVLNSPVQDDSAEFDEVVPMEDSEPDVAVADSQDPELIQQEVATSRGEGGRCREGCVESGGKLQSDLQDIGIHVRSDGVRGEDGVGEQHPNQRLLPHQ